MARCPSLRVMCAPSGDKPNDMLDHDSIRELVLRNVRSSVAKLVSSSSDSNLDHARLLQFLLELIPDDDRHPWDDGKFFNVLSNWILSIASGTMSS